MPRPTVSRGRSLLTYLQTVKPCVSSELDLLFALEALQDPCPSGPDDKVPLFSSSGGRSETLKLDLVLQQLEMGVGEWWGETRSVGVGRRDGRGGAGCSHPCSPCCAISWALSTLEAAQQRVCKCSGPK